MQLLVGFGVVSGLFFGLLCFVTGYNFRKIRELRRQKAEHDKAHTGPHKHDIPEVTQIVEGKRYSSLDSKCIAQTQTMFGWGWLMKTQHNNYFIILEMMGLISIQPQSQEEAIKLHTSSSVREVPFELAFPGEKIQDA